LGLIDPSKVAFWVPPELKKFKRRLFDRIGAGIKAQGGFVLYDDHTQLWRLPDKILPIVGCSPYLKDFIADWRARARPFIYWDRGYYFRVFATDLPVGINGGSYRWHLNGFQLAKIRDVPQSRWNRQPTKVWPWSTEGRHIVIAEPSLTYQSFHGIEGWTERTVTELKKFTDRRLVFRDKEMQRSGRKLHEDLKGAHCLVTHGSNAAVEAVIMGCPVFVDKTSAAALVGHTDLSKIETPVYPERQSWLNSLAFSQFTEAEMINGSHWRWISE
jgi:hypothetical protein